MTATSDFSRPWVDGPERGFFVHAYTAEWVRNHLQFGFGVTKGIPVTCVTAGDPPLVLFNLHHPPLYALWQTAFAALLGDAPWVLRLAHLLLLLPGVFALYALVASASDRLTGAMAALLLTSSPYVAFWATMPLHDGVSLSLLLCTCCLFSRHLDRPDRCPIRWPAIVFFLSALHDIPAYFGGFSMFVMALGRRPVGPALRPVAVMFLVAVTAFAVTAGHYGSVCGGAWQWLADMLHLHATEGADAPKAEALPFALEQILWRGIAWPLVGLALVGAVAKGWRRGTGRPLPGLGLALMVPGIVTSLAFPWHFVAHASWPLIGFGGCAVLAAEAVRSFAAAARSPNAIRRGLGRSLLAASVMAVVGGAVGGPALVHAETRSSQDRLPAPAMAATLGCEFVLVSAESGLTHRWGDAYLVNSVCDVGTLETLLQVGRDLGVRGELAFLLTARHFDSPLRFRLDQLARPVSRSGVLVYRFRVPPR